MERRKDLDFAKGVGIVLMVLGHSFSGVNGEAILQWLYSFHMPLFFIIPGIIYGAQHRKRRFKTVVCKKAKSLLLPYLFFGTATAATLCILGRKTLVDFGSYMYRILTLQGINAMWFIPCFLFAELLFFVCINSKYPVIGNFVIVITAVSAITFPASNDFISMLQNILVGSSFIALGYLLSGIFHRKVNLPTWITIVVIHVFLACANGQVSMASNSYGNFLLYYINGLIGTWLTVSVYHLLVSFHLEKIASPVTWFGQNTMIILCTSTLVIEALRVLDYKLFNNILPTLGSMEGILLCLIVLILEAFIIIFCSKYLWFLLGRSIPKNSISQ